MSSVAERGIAIMARVLPREYSLASRLGERYSRSEIHTCHEGDVLVLRGPSFGFGVRPVAVVKSYGISEDTGTGMYLVEMISDVEGDMMKGRTSEEQIHFKWNIEKLFRKVPRAMRPGQALFFYKGKEKSEWGKGLSPAA